MRHALKSSRFGRTPAHRKAMFRNLVTALLKHEKIETTEPKAKELRSWADKMITLGKKGDLHSRRQALAVITEKDVVKKLFDELGPRYAERPGGYTRVTKLSPRSGDAAPMAVIELIPEQAKAAKKTATKKAAAKKTATKKAAAKSKKDKADKTEAKAKKAVKKTKEKKE